MSQTSIDQPTVWFPGLAGLYAAVTPYAWPLMRVALGLILMPHGYAKLFGTDLPGVTQRMVVLGMPDPYVWAIWIGILEFFGALMLAVGLFTRVVAAMIAVEMAVICFLVLWPNWGWTNHGIEYSLMMGLFALGFALGGGGRCSLDRLIGREV